LKKKIIQRFLKQNLLIKGERRRRSLLNKIELVKKINNTLLNIPKMIGIPISQSLFGAFEIFGQIDKRRASKSIIPSRRDN
jgi:hypothetical protein